MDRFTQTFTVRWGDCDMNGHVRNTMYSEYAIETRMAYLTEHGFGYEQLAAHMIGPVLLREEIDYQREIRAGETVTVDLVVLGLSPEGGKWRFRQDLFRPNGKQAARVVVLGGWMDLRTRHLVPAPAALGEAIGNLPRAPEFQELPPLGSSRK
ncbi:thioesterase family protein [Anaeromyxobacter sp. Fw109-5]|uniref:acyl-CoA thioesterase n=1 Tax=Anaeromyxobacter sp. (strain Fw109-5) TaxID=404589 RepID=UPI0000ED6CBB|nr:thioesterase superfamily protein [Anaeromyxobacter sp. Fw109-5]